MTLRDVVTIPDCLEPGVLYRSTKYGTASHLCACGCGTEVVTPLGTGGWRISTDARGVSMFPSIGNWSFPCRSHYFIRNGGIQWAGAFTAVMVEAARRADNPRAYEGKRSFFAAWLDRVLSFIERLISTGK